MNSYPIGGGTAWPEQPAGHVSAETFADCVKEFRQYGYDPYNSADDAQHWHAYQDNRALQAVYQPDRIAKHIMASS